MTTAGGSQEQRVGLRVQDPRSQATENPVQRGLGQSIGDLTFFSDPLCDLGVAADRMANAPLDHPLNCEEDEGEFQQ